MELYILDDLLRRRTVIDQFESMIWTERFAENGDFELVLFSTFELRGLIKTGVRWAMNESYRVMVTEQVENKHDSEGRQMLYVKGRSLEAILEDRVARDTFVDLATQPKWVLTGTPASIARLIFNRICRTNTLFEDDNIPFLKLGSLMPASNIPEPSIDITVEFALMSVYDAIKQLCDTYDLGFRLLRNFDKSELYFDIYTGTDRTTLQTTRPPVIFSPELDNLTDTNEMTSIEDYKNVAYVFHNIGVQIVYSESVDSNIEGFARKVLYVEANDITVPDRPYNLTEAQDTAVSEARKLPDLTDPQKAALDNLSQKKRLTGPQVTLINGFIANTALAAEHRTALTNARNVSVAYNETENAYMNPLLQQKGREELAKHRSLLAFDGEIPTNGQYKYNIHYQLGDLIELRNSDGISNQMRVTEQIFVSDSEGERSYPTLTVDRVIGPGSWLSSNFSKVWNTAVGVWKLQP